MTDTTPWRGSRRQGLLHEGAEKPWNWDWAINLKVPFLVTYFHQLSSKGSKVSQDITSHPGNKLSKKKANLREISQIQTLTPICSARHLLLLRFFLLPHPVTSFLLDGPVTSSSHGPLYFIRLPV